MTTRDLAIAVAGATKPCPVCNGAYQFEPDMVCPDCDKGRVSILGERARRECKGLQPLYPRLSGHDNSCCAGRGWLPAFLLEPEECPCPQKDLIHSIVSGYHHSETCIGGCNGTGQIQRVDEERLRTLMEEAAFYITYQTGSWKVEPGGLWYPSLLGACAAALEDSHDHA